MFNCVTYIFICITLDDEMTKEEYEKKLKDYQEKNPEYKQEDKEKLT